MAGPDAPELLTSNLALIERAPQVRAHGAQRMHGLAPAQQHDRVAFDVHALRFVIGQVLIRTEPAQGSPRTRAPYIRGIIPSLETNLTVLPHSIVEGKFDVGDRGMLVGAELAQELRLDVGDHVLIYSPGELEKWEKAAREGTKERVSAGVEYEIRGLFDVGYFDFNSSVVVVSLRDAQELLHLAQARSRDTRRLLCRNPPVPRESLLPGPWRNPALPGLVYPSLRPSQSRRVSHRRGGWLLEDHHCGARGRAYYRRRP